MQITAIRAHRKGLSLLVLDGEPAMKLDSGLLYREGIRVGAELSDEELYRLCRESSEVRAKEKALYLLEHRPHFKRELEEKLRRDYPAEAAKWAADRMEELGLLDDAACGRQLAGELLNRKGFSSSRARLELCRKGLDSALAQEIIEELAPEPEEKIQHILEKKYPLAARDEKQRRRAVNALQRMGYRLPEIWQALRCLDETIELDEEQIWQ